eukprot:1138806-Pelagomonas_calceolata.AAC.1
MAPKRKHWCTGYSSARAFLAGLVARVMLDAAWGEHITLGTETCCEEPNGFCTSKPDPSPSCSLVMPICVQACRSTYWDSALDGQSCLVYSLAMHAPFLVPGPDGFTPASSTQNQQLQQQNDLAEVEHAPGEQGHAGHGSTPDSPTQSQLQQQQQQQQQSHADLEEVRAGHQPSERVQEQEAVCEFELSIWAPEHRFELRGWQGAADAPEDLPDAVKLHSLCLLATLGGRFLGVTVRKESLKQNGERVAQVRGLPPHLMFTAPLCKYACGSRT